MIPLKLELKNFLSYGENRTLVDFKNYSLICFSGKNGNGKSALLDAITWVVWGQARKISGTIKPGEGLLRLGQTRMTVSLEFEFSKNVYRVRREFAKTYGKSYTALDLEVFDSEKEKFISLTDKTVRLTQSKIEKLLGLDYETFVNSAFLRQGLADEFSKKTPRDRKQILANILGFSRYDELQKLAVEKSRAFQDERKLASKLSEQTQEQVNKEEGVKKLLSEQRQFLEKINKENANFQKSLVSYQKSKNAFIQKKQKYEFLQQEKENLKKRFGLKIKDFRKVIGDWKKIHYKSLQLPNLEELEEQKKQLNQREKEYLLLQQKSLTLQESILQKKDLYQKEFKILRDGKEKLINEKRIFLGKKELKQKQFLESLTQEENLKKELKFKVKNYQNDQMEIEKTLKKHKDIEKDLEKNKEQFEKRRAFYQGLIQKGNWIKTELKDLEQKNRVIKDQKSPSCPLCNHVLTIKRKVFLGSKFTQESNLLNYRLLRITNLIERLKEILFVQHEKVKKLDEQNLFCKQMEVKKEGLEKGLKQNERELDVAEKMLTKVKIECDILSKTIEIEKKDLDKLEKRLEQDLNNNTKIKEFALDIEKLEKEKNSLKYNKKIHLELQEQLSKIENSLKELDILKQELREQKERKNRANQLGVELKDLRKLISEVGLKIKDLDFDSKLENDLEQEISDINKRMEVKLAEKEKILQKIGSFQSELKRIENLKLENEKRRLRLEFLNDQIEEYKLLVQAFGKDGIQALLIEQVIPQIEQEANNILAKLTDNQSQVFIESLRDLKSGGVKETLDIQISDSAGIRPYEMFSGGEAFRIDFALRIAISKLLARRAGTALQTLIIDEGFGSQDEEGLSKLMDAIYAIQDDFSKIIVVSHLTNFKDNFPVHFLVDKDASGSFIRIQERG